MDWLLVSPDHQQASCRMGPCIPCPQLPALYQCWVTLEHADIFLHFLETVQCVNGYDNMHIKHKHHICNDAITWSHCDLRYCFEMKRLHRHDTTYQIVKDATKSALHGDIYVLVTCVVTHAFLENRIGGVGVGICELIFRPWTGKMYLHLCCLDA